MRSTTPTTTRSSSTPSSSNDELIWLRPDQIDKNSWNPNVVPPDVLEKARESLARYGWLAPVVVRRTGDGRYQLVDGEHRWAIAKESHRPIPAWVVDGLSEVDAKKATVILNDLHGQARPDKLAALVESVLEESSLEDLLVAFPYTAEALSALGSVELPSLEVGALPAVPPGPRWVERTYRLPPEVALVIDEAIEKAKDGDDIETWQALERIAADFLAS